MENKLSLIIPCYNNSAGLGKTLQSVFSQSYTNIEVVVVDGGSTDDTNIVLNQYKDKIIASSEPDKGIYDAVNKGIKRSSGDFICFLPGGDTFTNNDSLSILMAYTETHEIVLGNIYKVYPNGKKKKATGVNKQHPDVIDYVRGCTYPQAAIIKRQLFDKYGYFSTDYLIPSDLFLFYEFIVEHKANMVHIDYCAANFYMDGLSSKRQDISEREVKKYFSQKYTEETYMYFKELAEYRNCKLSVFALKMRNFLKRSSLLRRIYVLVKTSIS